MNILIFEDEYKSVKGAFEASNVLNFNESLKFVNFKDSQSFNFSEIGNYDIFFIDIELTKNSKLDGIGIIENIKNFNKDYIKKIVIMTANNLISDLLKERKINETISTIFKPLDFNDITKIIKEKNK